MRRFLPGNAIDLLRSGREYFPALLDAIAQARHEVWIETYIFADDAAGNGIADALVAAARRGVAVRVLVDGWGARHFLTPRLQQHLRDGGVHLLKYRPEVAPWQFRSHRMRRLHRKLAQVDGKVAFVGGINIIDDMNTPGHTPPRVDFAVRVRGPLLGLIVPTMHRLWEIVQLFEFEGDRTDRAEENDEELSLHVANAGETTAKFVVRDNLGHRRDIERAYLAAIRTAHSEIIIASAYFFPGIRFRRELIAAAGRGVQVTLLLQARVEYLLLHFASRALYGQMIDAGIAIQEYSRSFLHAKVAVVDNGWATVGSSNIDPYSLLMAREANVVVRDPQFADRLRTELVSMIDGGAERVAPQRWAQRPMLTKAMCWIAYGFVRVAMGFLGYGGHEWWKGTNPAPD
ncbi:MAG: cardiolipin synthase ClsB [Betaproteobacteria bacterium]